MGGGGDAEGQGRAYTGLSLSTVMLSLAETGNRPELVAENKD